MCFSNLEAKVRIQLIRIHNTYFRAGKLKEAKAALLKARRVAPQDTIILYNIALVLQKLASQLLRPVYSRINIKKGLIRIL